MRVYTCYLYCLEKKVIKNLLKTVKEMGKRYAKISSVLSLGDGTIGGFYLLPSIPPHFLSFVQEHVPQL